MLRPVLPAALDALLNMCTAFNASSEILGLVLENMTVVLSVSEFLAPIRGPKLKFIQ